MGSCQRHPLIIIIAKCHSDRSLPTFLPYKSPPGDRPRYHLFLLQLFLSPLPSCSCYSADMVAAVASGPLLRLSVSGSGSFHRSQCPLKLGFVSLLDASGSVPLFLRRRREGFGVVRSEILQPIRAVEGSRKTGMEHVSRKEEEGAGVEGGGVPCDCSTTDAVSGTYRRVMSTVGKSTNILWHECPVGKLERQKLLGQKGCVIWITGLSGSGKSTLACALSRELYSRGYLSYVLDGDNVRHGLNQDLSFKQEDRAENIRRIGEVAKLFADAGVICIASLISPYRRDRDACRALLPEATFIEVFMNMPLEICEARDSKGLYKLARAGKIKGFTGIDDPYEAPINCEIVIQQKDGSCPTPTAMAEQVIAYMEVNGYLQA